MAYSYALPDTSTRAKLNTAASGFALSDADIARYMAMLQNQGQQGLQSAFNAAQQNIGQQFTPAFRAAQARLGANPLLADSGYANRLNRQLQQSAFGDLSNAYSTAAANESQSQLQNLMSLINQQQGQRSNYLSALLSSAQKKPGFGDIAGQVLGSGLGAFGGSYLSALGKKAAA